jgi:hypothetical protein
MLLYYESEPETVKFHCAWKESSDAAAESRFFLPEAFSSAPEKIKITPEGKVFEIKPIPSEGKTFTWTSRRLGWTLNKQCLSNKIGRSIAKRVAKRYSVSKHAG